MGSEAKEYHDLTEGYFVFDRNLNDGCDYTLIGRLKDGKPEFEYVDGPDEDTFYTTEHFETIDECFDYLKKYYERNNEYEDKVKGRILPDDETLSQKEINQVVEKAGLETDDVKLQIKNLTSRQDASNHKFYTGCVEVPNIVSKNGQAYVAFNDKQISSRDEENKTAEIELKPYSLRSVRVMGIDGQWTSTKIMPKQLKDANDSLINARQKAIEDATLTGDNAASKESDYDDDFDFDE